MGCGVAWCNGMGGERMWCDVMWCDVMWCDVVWCDMMWECACEREGERACVCRFNKEEEIVCMCVRVYVRVRVCVYVRERDRERENESERGREKLREMYWRLWLKRYTPVLWLTEYETYKDRPKVAFSFFLSSFFETKCVFCYCVYCIKQ